MTQPALLDLGPCAPRGDARANTNNDMGRF